MRFYIIWFITGQGTALLGRQVSVSVANWSIEFPRRLDSMFVSEIRTLMQAVSSFSRPLKPVSTFISFSLLSSFIVFTNVS